MILTGPGANPDTLYIAKLAGGKSLPVPDAERGQTRLADHPTPMPWSGDKPLKIGFT